MSRLTVISGGQTGADLAGLWAAVSYNLSTGGKAPREWKTEVGLRPELQTFGLTESSGQYRVRTVENVKRSNLTLVCSSNIHSTGTILTLNACAAEGIKCIVLPFTGGDLEQDLERSDASLTKAASFLRTPLLVFDEVILNVAGNRESVSPKVFDFTFRACCSLFDRLGYTQQHFININGLRNNFDRSTIINSLTDS